MCAPVVYVGQKVMLQGKVASVVAVMPDEIGVDDWVELSDGRSCWAIELWPESGDGTDAIAMPSLDAAKDALATLRQQDVDKNSGTGRWG